jgi:septum formation protein
MLRKKAVNAAREINLGLSLGPDVDGQQQSRPVVPMSPTDANLSPCSKKLLGDHRTSHPDVRSTFKSRQWESVVEDDEEEEEGGVEGSDSEDSDASISESEGETEAPCDGSSKGDVDGLNNFRQASGDDDDDGGELSVVQSIRSGHLVRPRACPTSLPIILGSSSAKRLQIMEALGWEHTTLNPDIDEGAFTDSDAHSLCQSIAKGKAAKLLEVAPKPSVLITSDQVVEFGDAVRGKPKDAEQAREFLMSYSGSALFFVTAVVVSNTETGASACAVDVARVVMSKLSDDLVERVISRGLVMSAAGGLSLEDPDLQSVVALVDGELDSIWGLPVDTTCELICQVTLSSEAE